MDAEVTLFSKPEELIAWADTFDILLNPSIEDAAILLNYMEGHDYAIVIDQFLVCAGIFSRKRIRSHHIKKIVGGKVQDTVGGSEKLSGDAV